MGQSTNDVFPSATRLSTLLMLEGLLGSARALANGLRGDNPFSDACLIAMEYGKESIIKDDWKKIFQDDELDKNLARMLHLDKIER